MNHPFKCSHMFLPYSFRLAYFRSTHKLLHAPSPQPNPPFFNQRQQNDIMSATCPSSWHQCSRLLSGYGSLLCPWMPAVCGSFQMCLFSESEQAVSQAQTVIQCAQGPTTGPSKDPRYSGWSSFSLCTLQTFQRSRGRIISMDTHRRTSTSQAGERKEFQLFTKSNIQVGWDKRTWNF